MFQREKLRVFGPSKAASQLEGSKVFCKGVLHGADVPTGDYRVFRDATVPRDTSWIGIPAAMSRCRW